MVEDWRCVGEREGEAFTCHRRTWVGGGVGSDRGCRGAVIDWLTARKPCTKLKRRMETRRQGVQAKNDFLLFSPQIIVLGCVGVVEDAMAIVFHSWEGAVCRDCPTLKTLCVCIAPSVGAWLPTSPEKWEGAVDDLRGRREAADTGQARFVSARLTSRQRHWG